MMVWDIGPGDAVFVPDFTFFASGETPAYAGATPVFVDVEEDTFNISPASLEEAILEIKREGKLTPRVIVAVDLFGQPADYPRIRQIADRYGLLILEDGAQGFGGRIGQQRACSFGDISTTSFFPAKPLGCYGDGGAVFTDNDEWVKLLRSYRIHGKGTDKYDNVRIGMNSRLDTLQYSILLKDEAQRDGLQAYLKEKKIPTMVYYPKPMSRQGAFRGMDCVKTDLSVTADLCRRVLALPMHPYLTKEEQDVVTGEIRRYLSEKRQFSQR